MIGSGQIDDPEETAGREQQEQTPQGNIFDSPRHGIEIDRSAVGDETPKRGSVLGHGTDGDNAQREPAMTQNVFKHAFPGHSCDLGPKGGLSLWIVLQDG